MFTGIVSDIGRVVSVTDHGPALRRIRIISTYDAATIAMGASIACAGVCLTVVGFGGLVVEELADQVLEHNGRLGLLDSIASSQVFLI